MYFFLFLSLTPLQKKFLLHYFIVCGDTCHYACGGWRTACKNTFSPSAMESWVGTRVVGLAGKHHDAVGHFFGPNM